MFLLYRKKKASYHDSPSEYSELEETINISSIVLSHLNVSYLLLMSSVCVILAHMLLVGCAALLLTNSSLLCSSLHLNTSVS